MSAARSRIRVSSSPLPGRVLRARSLPAFAGAFALWIATWVLAGHGAGGTLVTAAQTATFLVLVGLGQMLVITSGNGGIDLSVPYVMTVSGFITASEIGGTNGGLVLGVLVAIGIGLGVGLANALVIELIQVPPIVATLAIGFLLDSVATAYSLHAVGGTAPAMSDFVSDFHGSWPAFGLFGLVVAVLAVIVMRRAAYGRKLEAVGQSPEAARLAGIKVVRLRASVYIISGILAALSGMLLASYSGSATLNMGDPYQLTSIAAVVLGGSVIAGGYGNSAGVWASALLLTLLTTTLNVARLTAGLQDVVEGAVIVVVLAVTGAGFRERKY